MKTLVNYDQGIFVLQIQIVAWGELSLTCVTRKNKPVVNLSAFQLVCKYQFLQRESHTHLASCRVIIDNLVHRPYKSYKSFLALWKILAK